MSTSSPKADIDASLEQTTLDYPKLAMALGGGRRGFVGTALSAASECLLLAQSGHGNRIQPMSAIGSKADIRSGRLERRERL
jgi:hypothetical protein